MYVFPCSMHFLWSGLSIVRKQWVHSSCGSLRFLNALLHQAIFPATCLAILLCRCKTKCTKHCLVSVTAVLRPSLRKVELESFSRKAFCNENTATHVHFRECYIGQFFVQIVSQQNCESSCRKNCLV